MPVEYVFCKWENERAYKVLLKGKRFVIFTRVGWKRCFTGRIWRHKWYYENTYRYEQCIFSVAIGIKFKFCYRFISSCNCFISFILENLKQNMVTNRKWLMEQTQYRSEEKKRQVERTYSDIFGMEGSFRQLSFD